MKRDLPGENRKNNTQSPKRPFNHKQDQKQKTAKKKTLHLFVFFILLLCVNRVKKQSQNPSLSTLPFVLKRIKNRKRRKNTPIFFYTFAPIFFFSFLVPSPSPFFPWNSTNEFSDKLRNGVLRGWKHRIFKFIESTWILTLGCYKVDTNYRVLYFYRIDSEGGGGYNSFRVLCVVRTHLFACPFQGEIVSALNKNGLHQKD